MTEGPTPPASDPAPAASGSASQQRRKPRRKRNIGKKNDATSNQQKKTKGSGKKSNNNNSGPPPPPQIKITIRNIQNAEKFGTVKSVLEGLVAKLIETCVEQKANNQYHIELDRAAFRHLITEDEKIEERRQLLIREKAQREEEKLNEGKENDEANDPASEQDVEMEETKEEETAVATDEAKKDDNKLDVILAPKTESTLPTLTARPSYVVPPRKTRRRGERGGVAYVLLIGPKIKKKEPTPAASTAAVTTAGEDATTVTKQEESMEEEKTADGETGDATATANKEPSEPSPPEKVINYPQELAKGRLLLSNAIKALIELVKEDSKSQEFAFSGCIVEHSMNGKTWKFFPNNNSRPDRREGTIEGSADFKEWLTKTANQKEELKARPKPVPGGGVSATSNVVGSDEVEEDGQIVSSLVQHLRAKKLESKLKKSQKKKKKDENNKAKKGDAPTGNDKKKKGNEKKNRKNNNNNNNGGAGKKTDAAAAAAKKAKGKKKERAKKNKQKAKTTAAAGGAKPPTALLKPQPTAT